ncbi:MAG: MOSC domain-containing protein [Cryomorphaceae bacterium]|nr:MAG: MOSC domain-containing protein [Cryomorphaceae bacterium]
MDWEKLPQNGIVRGLYTTTKPEEFITAPFSELTFEIEGIPGDRHAGISRPSGSREKKLYPKGTAIRNNRQWSALSVEELDDIAKRMGLEKMLPEWAGANLLIEGVEKLTQLPSLSLLKFFHGELAGPVLVVYGENKPCHHPHAAAEKALQKKLQVAFSKAAANGRGLVGWVEKPGKVHVGDAVEIWVPLKS